MFLRPVKSAAQCTQPQRKYDCVWLQQEVRLWQPEIFYLPKAVADWLGTALPAVMSCMLTAFVGGIIYTGKHAPLPCTSA